MSDTTIALEEHLKEVHAALIELGGKSTTVDIAEFLDPGQADDSDVSYVRGRLLVLERSHGLVQRGGRDGRGLTVWSLK